MKLVYAICGSFCTHARSLAALKRLAPGNDIYPAFSEAAYGTDTRFGSAAELREAVRLITGRDAIVTVKQAEETVTGGNFDAVIISPCTGNTLAKLAGGQTDNAVTMCAKAQLRSKKPVVIACATNDGLAASLKNVAALIDRKNIYFVPFGQDDPEGKPCSLVCDFSLLGETLSKAVSGVQIQPVITCR